jgi:hypothetical protein
MLLDSNVDPYREVRRKPPMYWHALQDGWATMAFDDFLADRRKRMAVVVRDAMARLFDQSYEPQYEAADVDEGALSGDVELRTLVDADVVPAGTTIVTGEAAGERVAQVLPDGRLYADGENLRRLDRPLRGARCRGQPMVLVVS